MTVAHRTAFLRCGVEAQLSGTALGTNSSKSTSATHPALPHPSLHTFMMNWQESWNCPWTEPETTKRGWPHVTPSARMCVMFGQAFGKRLRDFHGLWYKLKKSLIKLPVIQERVRKSRKDSFRVRLRTPTPRSAAPRRGQLFY